MVALIYLFFPVSLEICIFCNIYALFMWETKTKSKTVLKLLELIAQAQRLDHRVVAPRERERPLLAAARLPAGRRVAAADVEVRPAAGTPVRPVPVVRVVVGSVAAGITMFKWFWLFFYILAFFHYIDLFLANLMVY